jgi:3-oxoacyl-[acyl-carrier protein] reductase
MEIQMSIELNGKSSGKLSGKVALVTGGSRGIGRAVALAFAREGAALVGVHYGSNAEAAHATVRDIEALGAKAIAIGADLNKPFEAARSIAEQIKAAALAATGQPGIDILVNNAGVAYANSIQETDEALYDHIMNINTKAPFFIIRALADDFRDNGRIINVSTGFTRIAAPNHSASAPSKGAIDTLTLALAPVFGPRGITVNAVMPGVTETDMNAGWLADPAARAGAEATSVFSRLGSPDDVAAVIGFLASGDARWTTGQVIDASGGAQI